MRLILHQVAKDLRLLRWPIAAWVVLLVAFHAIAITVLRAPRLEHAAVDSLTTLQTAMAIAGTALFVVVAASLVQADSPCSTTAFWLTRPVPAGAMVAAKLVAAALVLVVLPITAICVDLLAAGDLASFSWPVAVPLVWLLPALAIAALTAGLAQFVLVSLLEAVLFAASTSAAAAFLVWNGPPRFVWLCAAFFAMCAAVLIHQYVTRRTRYSAVALALLPVAVVGMAYILAVARPGPPAGGWPSISVSLDRESAVCRHVGMLYDVRIPLRIAGVPPGADVGAWKVDDAALTFPDGQTHALHATIVPQFTDSEEITSRAIGALAPALAGATLLNPRLRSTEALAFTLAADVFEQLAAKSGVLNATVSLYARTLGVSAAGAVRAGTTLQDGPAIDAIVEVRAVGDRAAVMVRETAPAWNYTAGRFDYCLLRNDALGQAVLSGPPPTGLARLRPEPAEFGPVTPALPLGQPLRVRWSPVDFTWRPGSGDNVWTARWLQDAQLVLMRATAAGTFTRRTDVQEFRLSDIEARH